MMFRSDMPESEGEPPKDESKGKPEELPPILPNEESAAAVRPQSVDRAVKLLWISVWLSLLATLTGLLSGATDELNQETARELHISLEAASRFGLCVSFGVLLPLVFLIYKIDRGRNWARIIFIIMTIMGLCLTPILGFEDIFRNLLQGFITLAIYVLDIIAMYYLFQKSSSEWFKSKRFGNSMAVSNPFPLYEEAGRLAHKGQIKEALAIYDDITQRFGDSDTAKDAKIDADRLRDNISKEDDADD